MFQSHRSQAFALTAPAISALAIIVLLGLRLLVGPVAAAESRSAVFTVRDVAVDTTAATAAAAREQALAQGQRLAMQRLLARLTLKRDRAQLPNPSDQQLTDLVEGFEVQEEKNSTVRYIATLAFHFRSQAVEQLLRDAGVAFAETPSKPVLVLPVLRAGDTVTLWEDPNPWRAAWAGLPTADGLVPFLVPIGDANDIADISAADAAKGDEAKLNAIVSRYGAGSALVAVAAPQSDGSGSTVNLAVSRYGAGLDGQVAVTKNTAQPGETPDALLARTAQQVEADVAERWKEDNLLHFDQVQNAIVTIPIAGMADWLKVQQRLAQIATISKAALVYLSRNEARVDLSYLGDQAQLKTVLAQRDLVLNEEDGGLVLRLGGSGTGPSTQ